MSPRPALLGRSVLLLAMAACLPEPAQQRVSDDVEDLLRRFWSLAPDLASPETRAAIFEDLKARCYTGGRSLAGACSELGSLLDRWVNGGREPVTCREGLLDLGRSAWRGRVRLVSPGSYSAEVYCLAPGEQEISAWMQVPLSSLPDAWTAAQEAARQMDASLDRSWREAMARPAELTGETESGPVTPMEELSADEFAARYGIHDDLVKQDLPPEQRAKVQAWIEETLASRRPTPVNVGGWRPEDAADLVARHRDARNRLFSAYQAGDEARSRMEWPAELVSFDDVIKAARKWMSECDPAAPGVLLHIGVDPETATTDPRFLAGLAAGEIQHRGDRDWLVSRAFVLRDDGDTLTPAMIRRAAAELEANAIPKDADGMYRVPRFDDHDVRAKIEEQHRAVMSEQMRSDPNAWADYQAVLSGKRSIVVFDDGPFVGVDMARETEFDRAQRMAMNTPADRAMVGKTGPVDFKRAGERSRARLGNSIKPPDTTAAQIHEHAIKALAKPRPKVARDPEVKRERKAKAKARRAIKKTRGWS